MCQVDPLCVQYLGLILRIIILIHEQLLAVDLESYRVLSGARRGALGVATADAHGVDAEGRFGVAAEDVGMAALRILRLGRIRLLPSALVDRAPLSLMFNYG